VERDRLRRRPDPQLLAQPHAKRVVGHEALRAVPAPVTDLHQQTGTALPEGSQLDEASRRPLRRVELGSSDADRRDSHQLESTNEGRLEGAPRRHRPGGGLSRKKRALTNVLCDARGCPGSLPLPSPGCALRAVQRRRRHLDVDPRIARQRESELRPSLDRHEPAELRQQRAHRRPGRRRSRLLPEQVRDGLAVDRVPSLQHEVREQQTSLSPRELGLDAVTGDARDKGPAQLYPRLHPVNVLRRQGFANTAATMSQAGHGYSADPIEGGTMGKRIDCECGEVVKADDDDELVAKVEAHVGAAHPELVGKMTREDVLGMAVEDD
jgi:hypothetical protein